ncbi:MAG: hypothetical protein MJZ46_05420 [Bacteroidales bacterium]|nr:hypothetical protein [Bacteroidales bacterium]
MFRFAFILVFLASLFSAEAKKSPTIHENVDYSVDKITDILGLKYDSLLIYTHTGTHYLIITNEYERINDTLNALKVYDALKTNEFVVIQEVSPDYYSLKIDSVYASIYYNKDIFSHLSEVEIMRNPNDLHPWDIIAFVEKGKLKLKTWIPYHQSHGENSLFGYFCDSAKILLKEIEEQ